MTAGIIASAGIEADLVISQLSKKEALSIQGKSFYRGILGQHTEVIVCICGVGKTNAAHGTTLLLEKFSPDLVYVIGVGGAYPSSGLKVEDIAIAEKEIYGDEGLIIKGQGARCKGQGIEKESFQSMDMLKLPLAVINNREYYNEFPMFIPEKLKDIKRGNFVTVSTCTGILERGKEIEKKFRAICENMEGAAVAQICALSGIPVVEIRGISNIIEDRTATPLNKSDIIKAAENVQRFFLESVI